MNGPLVTDEPARFPKLRVQNLNSRQWIKPCFGIFVIWSKHTRNNWSISIILIKPMLYNKNSNWVGSNFSLFIDAHYEFFLWFYEYMHVGYTMHNQECHLNFLIVLSKFKVVSRLMCWQWHMLWTWYLMQSLTLTRPNHVASLLLSEPFSFLVSILKGGKITLIILMNFGHMNKKKNHRWTHVTYMT